MRVRAILGAYTFLTLHTSCASDDFPDPEPIVDAYLAAYNRQDLDAVLATVAEAAPFVSYPDSLQGRGHPYLRVELPRQWRTFDDEAAIKSQRRFTYGHFVADVQLKAGIFETLVVFEVRDGLIQQVTHMDGRLVNVVY